LYFALLGVNVAELRTAFTPKQIAIGAAFFHDGQTQAEIAERMGLSQQSVSQILATLKRRVERRMLPAPRRFKARNTRHIRQLDMAILS
jgi:DNA-binding MarR family transcriptional regulator